MGNRAGNCKREFYTCYLPTGCSLTFTLLGRASQKAFQLLPSYVNVIGEYRENKFGDVCEDRSSS
jgi:hypothetical protein